ncbi:MAG: flagellar basal body-associated FliL family protein [Abditibacteriales bacterium]|nr:flagellar basal body-associated FliL family protein [Abditibacteriales bacterium]MDW8367394.1 flagellar basal body-associated FliL family protein [Abditibacteriales bacterium]
MKIVRILVPVVGMLLAGAAGGIFAGKVFGSNHKTKEHTTHASKTKHEVKAVHELSEFIVNLADRDPAHFAKVTIALGLTEETHDEKELKKYEPPIRDAVLELLTAKRYEELLEPKGKAQLKKQILERVQEIMGEEKVAEIYFTNFAMQ